MGVVREVLFGKIDLDLLTTALVLGLDPTQMLFRRIEGSAPATALSDGSVVCLEVGGSGRTDKNNFDHHATSFSLTGKKNNLSACAQALRRLARLVEYVDELDRGVRRSELIEDGVFPSLAQLISGMLLVVKDSEQRMRWGLEILRAVVQSGIDPYGSMEPILDAVPHARWWAAQKRTHDAEFERVCTEAQWFTTKSGRRLAVIETTWIGAPGALYGRGAEIVLVLNPAMECGKRTIRKYTLAGHRISVLSALEELTKLESGWGGPEHGTIVGSPRESSSRLSLDEVKAIAIEML